MCGLYTSLIFLIQKNNIHSVQICINSRWQAKNKTGQLLSKFLKRAQEKQSESSSQLCTITIYGDGAMPLLKKHIQLKSTNEIQH